MLRNADIDVDRRVGKPHGLDDRNTGMFEKFARIGRLIDVGEDQRFRVLSQQGDDGLLFLDRRITAVQHHDLKTRRLEHVVKYTQIVGENAIGQ